MSIEEHIASFFMLLLGLGITFVWCRRAFLTARAKWRRQSAAGDWYGLSAVTLLYLGTLLLGYYIHQEEVSTWFSLQ